MGDKSYTVLKNTSPQAVVIYCSDPRLQTAFREFITNELQLEEGEYIPLVVSGGGAALARPLGLPKEFKFVKERLEFFRDNFKTLTRVVVINHEDCVWYKELGAGIVGKLLQCAHPSREDMGLVLQVLTRTLSHLGLQVELYYAKFTDATQTKVAFEKLN